jgi:hypothetical protein
VDHKRGFSWVVSVPLTTFREQGRVEAVSRRATVRDQLGLLHHRLGNRRRISRHRSSVKSLGYLLVLMAV